MTTPASTCFRIAAATVTLFYAVPMACSEDTGPAEAARLILFAGNQRIQIGPYSAFARFQTKLLTALKDCKRDAAARQLSREAEGMWSATTSLSIRQASSCKSLKSASKNGALTSALWHDVMGNEDSPSLQEKSAAISLTFEATGFNQKPEWNFCQDSADPLKVARAGGATAQACYNKSDPCSLLTWGPRGATAGQGREIQWVLANVMRRDPALVASAFGFESQSVQRFVSLEGPPAENCDGSTPLEHFMCDVWISDDRRLAWEMALQNLGKMQTVRSIYDAVYARQEFDGYKLEAYYDLWEKLGVEPSEIDFAFFYDRSTHIGAPPDDLKITDLKQCLDAEPSQVTRNAAARRCLSRIHPHPTQPKDRYARDTAYYIDSYTAPRLTAVELTTWQKHIPLAAGANFGLSDSVRVTREKVTSAEKLDIEPPVFGKDQLTADENACPVSILRPLRERP